MNKTSNTSERLIEYMKLYGLRQTDILEKCKPYCDEYNEQISKALLSAWIKGKAEPRQNKLYILALALNVNESWLMGFDIAPDRNDFNRIIKEVDSLPEDQFKRLLAYMEAFNDLKKEEDAK